LLQQDEPRIHVVARLPFWSQRPEGTPHDQALVVTAASPDPSGADRTLIGLEVPLDMSRARLAGALTEAGLAPEPLILRCDPGVAFARALADVGGFVEEGDPRLRGLRSLPRPHVSTAPVYANLVSYLVAAWLLIFLASVRELGVSIFLIGLNAKVLAPAIEMAGVETRISAMTPFMGLSLPANMAAAPPIRVCTWLAARATYPDASLPRQPPRPRRCRSRPPGRPASG